MITHNELLARYEKTIQDDLVRDLAHHIHDGYADALDKCRDFDPEFAKQAVPQVRHYSIQTRVKAVARSHQGVSVETYYTVNKSEPYAVLTVGEFLLTISMVKGPGLLPPPAHFRRVNAIANESLFSEIEAQLGMHAPCLHNAILIHVPSPDNRTPCKMAMVFPNGDYSRPVHTIDLTPLVAFDLDQSEAPQEIIDTPVPKLRKRLPKKGAM